MTHTEVDIAPPPEDTLQLVRLRCGGWIVIFDGESQAAFSSLTDLTRWLDEKFSPLEQVPTISEPLPTALTAAAVPQKPLWRVFSRG